MLYTIHPLSQGEGGESISTSVFSPSATSTIFSPVAGLTVGKIAPLTASHHSLLINNLVYFTSGAELNSSFFVDDGPDLICQWITAVKETFMTVYIGLSCETTIHALRM